MFSYLLSQLFPDRCVYCSAWETLLCSACQQQLIVQPKVTVLKGELKVFSWLNYERVFAKTITAYKDQNLSTLAPLLASWLKCSLLLLQTQLSSELEQYSELKILVPPESKTSRQSRGYSPMKLLLKELALGSAELLEFQKEKLDQSTLSRSERKNNLANSMRLRGAVEQQAFVLVDDLVTTGATLLEMSRVVEEAGGKVIAAATIARSELKRSTIVEL